MSFFLSTALIVWLIAGIGVTAYFWVNTPMETPITASDWRAVVVTTILWPFWFAIDKAWKAEREAQLAQQQSKDRP
jgi:hypothetical protein